MTSEELFNRLRTDVLGLDRTDPVQGLDGMARRRRRVYLDTTATSLMPRLVWEGLQSYFATSTANSHTQAHRAGRSTTHAIEEARAAVGRLVGVDEREHVVLFTGNGATGAINFMARALYPPELRLPLKRSPNGPSAALLSAFKDSFPQGARSLEAMVSRPLVVTTLMEHHSNLLPWFEAVGRHNVRVARVLDDGRLDLDHLDAILREEGRRVRLVAVSGASNVTGIVTPIHDIAQRAHAVGAQILVDAAQLAPHRPMEVKDLDFVVISGHKLYAPGSRGVVVGRMNVLNERRCVGDVGGGMVDYVTIEDFRVKDEVTAREEAGTPNIPGTVSLGIIAEMLGRVGMDRVARHESELIGYALDRLHSLPGIIVYGTRDPKDRVGVISLNVEGVAHGLASAFLDDAYNVATRNECFCAAPYVKALLKVDSEKGRQYLSEVELGDRRHIPGMVRLSLGIYSTREDVDVTVEALADLRRNRDAITRAYEAHLDGGYRRRGAGEEEPIFTPSRYVSAL